MDISEKLSSSGVYRLLEDLIKNKEALGCIKNNKYIKDQDYFHNLCKNSMKFYSLISGKTRYYFAGVHTGVEPHFLAPLFPKGQSNKERRESVALVDKYITEEPPYIGKYTAHKNIIHIELFKVCYQNIKTKFSAKECKNYNFVTSNYSEPTGGYGKHYHQLKSLDYLPKLFELGEVKQHIYLVKYPLPDIPNPKSLVFTGLDKLAGLVKSVQKKADDTAEKLKGRVENAERRINQKIDDTGDRIGKQVDKISPF